MKRTARALTFAASCVLAGTAAAEPQKSAPANGNLRAHVGADVAARLMRSTDPDEIRQGIARAASQGTPEAVALLVQGAEASGNVDARTTIAFVHALAPFASQERARAALLAIAARPKQPSRRSRGSDEQADDGASTARLELAQQEAAIAVARVGTARAHEQLFALARGQGPGQAPALLALSIEPPRDPGFLGTAQATLPTRVVAALGELGDLRALEPLHAATRSADASTRAAAIVALARLGDARAVPVARALIAEPDARMRAAAAEAFILLSAPERFPAVRALIADEPTTALGVRLAERVHDREITKLLGARVLTHPEPEVRAAVVAALGRSPDPAAADALAHPAVLANADLAYPAMLALARSPAPNAGDLLAALAEGKTSARSTRLAVRGYVVRALARGQRSSRVDRVTAKLFASGDPTERALGALARVALDDVSLERALEDRDVRVRRAALMGALARPSRAVARVMLERLGGESDATTAALLGAALLDPAADDLVTTRTLLAREAAAGADAPLIALAIARRARDEDAGGALSLARRVSALLASPDPVLRAHAALGLATSSLSDASGRLATAYTYEGAPEVRRAIVSALALRVVDESAPSRRRTLELAASLDPDGLVRREARRGLGFHGHSAPPPLVAHLDVAWLEARGAPAGSPFVGSLLRSDGVAIPIVFDDEGFALVPGAPPGEARLILAPRVPSYDAPAR